MLHNTGKFNDQFCVGSSIGRFRYRNKRDGYGDGIQFNNDSNKQPFHETYILEKQLKRQISILKYSIIPIVGTIRRNNWYLKQAVNEFIWRNVAWT